MEFKFFGTWLFGPLSLVFVLKLIPAFIGQNNTFFIMHVLKKDVLLLCMRIAREKKT
jgi:hypothetical protein